jgi:hypothetical protein
MVLLTYWQANKQGIDLYYVVKNSFWVLVTRNFLLLTWVVINVASFYYLSFAIVFSVNVIGSLSVFVWDHFIYGIFINHYQKGGVFLGLLGSLLTINSNYLISLVDPSYEIQTNFKYFKAESIS